MFQFKQRWTQNSKPAFVGDAAFSSFEFIEESARWEGKGWLFSVPNTVLPHVWHVLSANLYDGHWRAAINDKGWIAAVHCIQDDTDQTKITSQQILTNLYKIS